MKRIEMITDKQELNGHRYIELLPGVYTGDGLSDQSAYFSEEVFGLLEPTFENLVSDFNRYAFTEIPSQQLPELVTQLRELQQFLSKTHHTSQLNGRVDFVYESSEDSFELNFKRNQQALDDLIDQLCDWLDVQTIEQDAVTLLGL